MNLLVRTGLHMAAISCGVVSMFFLMRLWFGLGEAPALDLAKDAVIALASASGAALCWMLVSRLLAKQHADEAERPDFTGQHFEAHQRVLFTGFVGSVLVVGCLASLRWAMVEPHWLTLGLALFLVVTTTAFIHIGASQYRSGRPTLVMDGHGLDHAWFGRIAWDQVHGLMLKHVELRNHRVYSLLLGVARPHRYLAQVPRLIRITRYRKVDASVPSGVLEIPLNPLDQLPQVVFAAARGLRKRVRPGPVAGWHPELSDEDVALARDVDALDAEIEQLPPDEALARMLALAPRMEASRERAIGRLRRGNRALWLRLAVVLLVGLVPLAWLLFHPA